MAQEISFIKQYMDLLKSRFDEEISFDLIINHEESLEKRIPYLSLQLVAENAIKHNIATIDNPLAIIITVEKNGVIVKNTWQPKTEEVQSEKFGLDYLNQIYGYFKNNNLDISLKDGYFICFLPVMY
ncbi:hypothetical protein [Chryseobacterium indoltheticum]|uniref:hypothetical protein n=1 Tax=Chryseobacterium indoltheticum TaxID=254 RepID=UPI003F498CC9